jgi:coenzyme F420-reducing hydrogenase delta subunit
MGIEPERIRLTWVSSAEGPQFAEEMKTFIERIRSLGPVAIPSSRSRGSVDAPDKCVAVE